jgi:hypothetical protein
MRMGLAKQDHLDPARGPKRILALEGGGIRGILTLQFLKTVETLVKQASGTTRCSATISTSSAALRPDGSSRPASPTA